MQSNTILEKLGGHITIEIIVENITQQLLEGNFKMTDMKKFKEQMQNFLIILFGDKEILYKSATNDRRQNINNAYKSLGISNFWLVEGLNQALNELGISDEIKTEVTDILCQSFGIRVRKKKPFFDRQGGGSDEIKIGVRKKKSFQDRQGGGSDEIKKEATGFCQSIGSGVQGKRTIYDRLGGNLAIQFTVDQFVQSLQADYKLKGFFTKMDMKKLNQQMCAFLTMVFGGPSNYFGKSMVDAHKGLGINDEYFDLVVKHLCDILNGLGTPEDVVTEILDVCESIRDDVLGK